MTRNQYFGNKKVILYERKRHTARRILSTPYAVSFQGGGGEGGYPIQSWLGTEVPIQSLPRGLPYPILAWGVPHPVLSRYREVPHPILARGYLLPDLAGVPCLVGTWDQALGYPSTPRKDLETGYFTGCGLTQTENITFPIPLENG